MDKYFQRIDDEQFSFLRVPKSLMKNPEYAPLSAECRLLYGLLLDRMCLSEKNGWRDELGRTFIYYSISAISHDLGYGESKVQKMMRMLESAALLEKRRMGLCLPNRLYVLRFNPECSKTPIRNGEIHRSGMVKYTVPEWLNSPTNNTEKNNTEYSDTYLSSMFSEMEDEIKDQIDYPVIIERFPDDKGTIDAMVSVMRDVSLSKEPTLKINGCDIPRRTVEKQLMMLDFTHVEYVLECMHQTAPAVRNIRAYLLSALYNSPSTIDSYYDALLRHNEQSGNV